MAQAEDRTAHHFDICRSRGHHPAQQAGEGGRESRRCRRRPGGARGSRARAIVERVQRLDGRRNAQRLDAARHAVKETRLHQAPLDETVPRRPRRQGRCRDLRLSPRRPRGRQPVPRARTHARQRAHPAGADRPACRRRTRHRARICPTRHRRDRARLNAQAGAGDATNSSRTKTGIAPAISTACSRRRSPRATRSSQSKSCRA